LEAGAGKISPPHLVTGLLNASASIHGDEAPGTMSPLDRKLVHPLACRVLLTSLM